MTARKTTAKPKVAPSPIDALFADRESISAAELAEFVNRDPKVVRGALRQMAARDQSTEKNNRWLITKEIATAAADHFAKSKKAASA